LIQRPWDSSFDEYLSYGQKDQEENKPHNAADLKRTQGGRPVYSGGGVEPDRHVPGQFEGFNPSPFGRLLVARQEFEDYAQKFTAEGDARITQQATGRRSVAKNFTVDDTMVADFREHLKTRRLKIDEDAFAKDLPFIKAMIRYRIEETIFGMAEAKRHLLTQDPQAQAGLSLFGEAEKLLAMGKVTRAH
jgi:carboxyl-terminal processing protease